MSDPRRTAGSGAARVRAHRLLTTDPTDLPLLRVSVPADEVTGLREASRVMVDTVTTTRRDNLRDQVGRLSATDMVRVERALLVFLGLAG